MSNYKIGEWYNWNGGDVCPVDPRSTVEALWIDEDGSFVRVGPCAAFTVAWSRTRTAKHSRQDPVSAFRVIKEYREPMELWVCRISGDTSTYKQHGMVLFREVVE